VRPHSEEIDLAAELRALRPTPRAEFAEALDRRAAAGFPSASRHADSAANPIAERLAGLGRIPARLRAIPRRRLLVPAGATATAAIAVATALVIGSEGGPATSPSTRLAQPAGESSGVQYSAAPPVKAGSAALDAGRASAGSGEAAQGAAPAAPGPYAARAAHRDVERAAEIVLGTRPSEVHEVASRVLQTVHTYQGIVLRSSIHDVGEADSTFDLLIPSSKLSDALAAFSEAGEVLSRRESTVDVTARRIGLGERLRDAEATVKGLLAQLARAESSSEREVVEAELHSARRRAGGLRSRLSSLRRRVHFSRVSLRIDSKPGAIAGSGHWGLSDALRDAGHVLTVAAGIVLVGLAILLPPLLIALLAWLARRGWVRRRRERALD